MKAIPIEIDIEPYVSIAPANMDVYRITALVNREPVF